MQTFTLAFGGEKTLLGGVYGFGAFFELGNFTPSNHLPHLPEHLLSGETARRRKKIAQERIFSFFFFCFFFFSGGKSKKTTQTPQTASSCSDREGDRGERKYFFLLSFFCFVLFFFSFVLFSNLLIL
jgi:hypothetical protein